MSSSSPERFDPNAPGIPVHRSAGHEIRIGIGGWVYDPWRETFYPPGLPSKQQLAYASRQLTAIEINGTFYRTPSRDALARWRDETPDGFRFSVKASRFCTQGKRLAERRESIERFLSSGLTLLGPKLGPILWQMTPTRSFDAEDLEAFLRMLPAELDGMNLRHVLEVRHPSFACPEYLALARRYRTGTVFADTDEHPSFCDITGNLVYARMMRTISSEPTGYSPAALDYLARHMDAWADGQAPAELPRLEPIDSVAPVQPRPGNDVWIFFIAGAKERAPAAARGLIDRLTAAI